MERHDRSTQEIEARACRGNVNEIDECARHRLIRLFTRGESDKGGVMDDPVLLPNAVAGQAEKETTRHFRRSFTRARGRQGGFRTNSETRTA